MAIRVLQVEATPNPNARKFVLDRRLWDEPRSYFSPGGAATDALAANLFGIDGVCAVLLLHDFITVNKRPEVDWRSILPAVRAVLRGFKT